MVGPLSVEGETLMTFVKDGRKRKYKNRGDTR